MCSEREGGEGRWKKVGIVCFASTVKKSWVPQNLLRARGPAALSGRFADGWESSCSTGEEFYDLLERTESIRPYSRASRALMK